MAMRKIGRGKGALRNISSSPIPGSIASAAVRSGSPKSPCAVYSHQDQLLEVRVTGITDLTSFWVQMGTGKNHDQDLKVTKLKISVISLHFTLSP